MGGSQVEIERKYIILIPDVGDMMAEAEYTRSDILQTYLSGDVGVTHRVRMRKCGDETVYTETKKRRIDEISSFEEEQQIDEATYLSLLKKRDAASVTIEKTRHTFVFQGQLFEVDVYPQWAHTCIMETELEERDKEVHMPTFIRILREVTGDGRYSNAAMSSSFPRELV